MVRGEGRDGFIQIGQIVRELLSPKQVARAIGVSESSLKRWCDRGLLATQRTGGGHRRLPVSGVLKFLRDTGHVLVHPEMLGLPPNCGRSPRAFERLGERLREALEAGNELVARQLIFDAFLAGELFQKLGDELIGGVLKEVGERWACGTVDVYQERRACQILLQTMHDFRLLVPQPPADAPIAIGGTPTDDPYTLPTLAVELTLRECQWNATSLGSNLPFSSLQQAAEDLKPQLLWLSVSHIADHESFIAGFNALFDFLVIRNCLLVVGGYALTEEVRTRMRYSVFCDRLLHLRNLVLNLKPLLPNGHTSQHARIEVGAPESASSFRSDHRG